MTRVPHACAVGRDPVEALAQYKKNALASEVSTIHHLEGRLGECRDLEKDLGNSKRAVRKMKRDHKASLASQINAAKHAGR